MGFVGYCFDSRYAAGNCDSSVPFYDMYNTQLCVGLFVFHLLVPFEGALLGEYTLHGALLPGSFLHFQQCIHMFVQPMCPLHSGLKVAS